MNRGKLVREMEGSILSRYPKIREDLPPAYQAIYASHYKKNREGETKTTSLSQRLERWLHTQVAKDVVGNENPGSTLEIGAGTLNQLDFEPKSKAYDIIEPFKELFEHSARLEGVRDVYADIGDIDEQMRYDRITNIAVFEHIMDLPFVVAKAALLLKDQGSLRVSIPNEGTILWKMGTMITGAEYKKLYGLDYQVLMKFEHVNTADEIEAVLRYFFKEVDTSVFGLSRSLAFYRFSACRNAKRDVAKDYLTNR